MTDFNGLTAAEREILDTLIEEAAEVIQASTKMLRHGKRPTDYSVTPPKEYDNTVSLAQEVVDLLVLVEIAIEAGLMADYDEATLDLMRQQKRDRLRTYFHHVTLTS